MCGNLLSDPQYEASVAALPATATATTAAPDHESLLISHHHLSSLVSPATLEGLPARLSPLTLVCIGVLLIAGSDSAHNIFYLPPLLPSFSPSPPATHL